MMLTESQRLQDFSSEADRRRLSATAIKAYVRLAANWQITDAQAAMLLDISSCIWDRLKSDADNCTLSQDQLTRVSAIVGIYKGLHLIFADDNAVRWPKLPNCGPLFAGMSPVDAMIKGGIPHMLEVRRYIGAVRGGL